MLKDGIWTSEPGSTGTFNALAIFKGEAHYENTSRRITLKERNGIVSKDGEQSNVTVQVKDLDGWQPEIVVRKGAELFVSAVQGFGTNRKFNRWVEFSKETQQLRTANVQSPFSPRTALLVQDDMTLFAHYNFTFSGSVVNGYLAGSKVFLDLNWNGLPDDDEPFGFTKATVNMNSSFEELIRSYDKNQMAQSIIGAMWWYWGYGWGKQFPCPLPFELLRVIR